MALVVDDTGARDDDPLTEGSAKRLASRGFADPVFFCKLFLSHLFPGPIPWIHRGLLAILTKKTDFLIEYGELDKIINNFVVLEDPSVPFSKENPIVDYIFEYDGEHVHMTLGKNTLIKMPRGFSKTTIAGIAVPLYKILYQVTPFFAYLSESGPHASMQCDNVKRELEVNQKIRHVFGDLKPMLKDAEKWREGFFETTTNIAMLARGRNGQVRGLNHNGVRPTEIIFDDVEDKESVKTEAQREKAREWMYGDVIPALPELNPDATLTGLGTLLHPQALLQTLSRDPDWTVVSFGALDLEGQPIWSANMNLGKLARRKQSFAAAGQLHTFYMEYYNRWKAPESQIFKPEYIVHETPKDLVATAIYVDPAISAARRADDTVIIVAGITSKGIIYILDVWYKKGATPRELIDKYFAWSKRFACRHHGVEAVAYQAALTHIMREEMFRKKHYFEITEVKHAKRGTGSTPTKKEDRISLILGPRYANGYIRHARAFPKLETQLVDFSIPSIGHDDGPDAEAGVVSLLDPHAAAAAGDEDLSEDEYPPIEEVIGGEYGDCA